MGRASFYRTSIKKMDFSYDALGIISGIKKWKSEDTWTYERREHDMKDTTSLIIEDETGKCLTKREYVYDEQGRLLENWLSSQ